MYTQCKDMDSRQHPGRDSGPGREKEAPGPARRKSILVAIRGWDAVLHMSGIGRMEMEYSEEKYFVRSFVRKAKRERLLYELTTPGKRNAGVSRFCHQAADFLDAAKIRMNGSDLERRPEFRAFVREHDEICFVLSPEPWLNEQHLPLSKAVEMAAMSTDAVLILGSTFAVVFTEAMKNGREKYLLRE